VTDFGSERDPPRLLCDIDVARVEEAVMPGVPQIPMMAATQMASVRLKVRRLPQRLCRKPNPTAP
jgi:hypothetical protein